MSFDTQFNFTKAEIEAAGIRVQDETEDLKLYCYEHDGCDQNSSDIVKATRGVVFKDNQLYAANFPYTSEHVVYREDDLKFIDLEKTRFFAAYEGCIIRVFYDNTLDKWHVSTTRRLDAYKSHWASRTTFGEYFDKCTGIPRESYNERFDKNRVYMFLLSNSDKNRIVCHGSSMVYLIGWFDTFSTKFHFAVDDEFHGFATPVQYKFISHEELYHAVTGVDITKTSGFVCFTENQLFRLTNEQYSYFYSLRGNEASVMFRYLQIRQSRDEKSDKMIHDLMVLYPSFVEMFDKYEDWLELACSYIHAKYIERHVRKQFNQVATSVNDMINKCHSWHKSSGGVVTLDVVRKLVNEQDAVHLNKIIKEQRERTVKQE